MKDQKAPATSDATTAEKAKTPEGTVPSTEISKEEEKEG